MRIEDVANLHHRASPSRWHTGGSDWHTYVIDELGHVVAETNGPDEARATNAAVISMAVNALPTFVAFHDALKALVLFDPYFLEYDDGNSVGRCVYCLRTDAQEHANDCVYLAAKTLLDTYDIR